MNWGGNTGYKGRGCTRCYDSGYRGRLGIFEILTVSPAIAQMITQRSSSQEILERARVEGMTTMMEDGVEKVMQGITTVEELARVTYSV